MDTNQFTHNQFEEQEEWRPVVGYEGLYSVSNMGRVRRDIDGKGTSAGLILKLGTNPNGYHVIALYDHSPRNGRSKSRKLFTVHSLVAAAFIGQRPEGFVINHISGIKKDNRPQNLEYCTSLENQHHATAMKLRKRGEDHVSAKLTEGQVREIHALLMKRTYAKEIAIKFGVSEHAVRRIRSGESWAHIAVEFNHPRYDQGCLHHQAKLTAEKVREIRAMLLQGVPQRQIAEKYKVCPMTISSIKNGTRWNHVE